LEDLLKPFENLAKEPSWRVAIHIADVLLVAYVIYRVLALMRGTRAWRVVTGIFVFVLLLGTSSALHFDTLNWMLEKATLLAPVALAILLLPELRQALEYVGRLGVWTNRLTNIIVAPVDAQLEATTIEEIVGAVAEMSAGHIGALIVLERGAALADIVANGVQIDANVTGALLISIFYEGNPLHDGAVIVRGHRIVAAACRLPLSESSRLDASYHMRHRAAMGLTAEREAMVIVVSEEKGSISIASEGKITRLSGPTELRDALNQTFRHHSELNGGGKRRRAAKVKAQ
jgi:diadenylate cyclase